MSSNPTGGESGDRPKSDVLDEAARSFDSEAQLSPQLRAALRGDLAPSAENSERVRHRLWSAISTGALPPAVHRVDLAMATRAAGLKAGVAAVGHTLATKLIVSSLSLIVVGATGVVAVTAPHRAASNHPRTTQVAAQNTTTSHMSSIVSRSHAEPNAVSESESDVPSSAVPSSAVPSSEMREVPTSLGSAAKVPADALPTPSIEPTAPSTPPSAAANTVVARSPTATNTEPATQHTARPLRLALLPRQTRDTLMPVPLTAAGVQTPSAVATPEAAVAPSVTAAPPTPTLNAELALVHAASAALERHDSQSALESVSRYMTQYPEGGLRAEVDALHALAMCLAQSPGAAFVRDAFLHEHPTSALGARVLRACAQSH